jgi:hypothetical protein
MGYPAQWAIPPSLTLVLTAGRQHSEWRITRGERKKGGKEGPGPFLDIPFTPVEATLLVGLIENRRRSRNEPKNKIQWGNLPVGISYLGMPTVHATAVGCDILV